MALIRTIFALAVIATATTAVATPGFAQRPDTPEDIIIPPVRSQPPVSQSDEYRVVGKVLQIDRERGRVKLATDKGVVVVEAPPRTLQVIRVGETVSVPRAGSPSASPRE